MSSPRVVGRFALYNEIAAGGMATVHLGQLIGSGGVHRLVAIKRLHAQFAKDPEFVRMFLDEGRLAARIHHPNVVSLLDFISLDGELFLVMEYVHGDSLSGLLRAAQNKGEPVPLKIAASLIVGVLQGLHAAHTAKSEHGEPLAIVHRDVSPQNILVSSDGVARLLDFGVAQAAGRLQTTRAGQIKGKIAYMAPEQLRSAPVDPRADVYAAGVVLWEVLTGRRLFQGDAGAVLTQILLGERIAPSHFVPDLEPVWNHIFLKATSPRPDQRYATAQEMADAVESAGHVASGRVVGQWVTGLLGETLLGREAQIRQIEQRKDPGDLPSSRGEGGVSIATQVEPFSRAPATSDASLPSMSDTSLPSLDDANGSGVISAAAPRESARSLSVEDAMPTLNIRPQGLPRVPRIVEVGEAPYPSFRKRPRWLFVSAGVLSLALGGIVLGSRFGCDVSDAASSSTVPPPASADAVNSAGGHPLPIGSSDVVPPNPEVPASIAEASRLLVASSASAAAPVAPVAKAHDGHDGNPRARPLASSRPVTGSAVKSPDCKNPFIVGPDGDMHVRRECL